MSEGGPALSEWELTTVADDEAVAFAGTEVRHWTELEPDTEYSEDGLTFRTLPRPPGERLATVATVNDMHFGETRCGLLEGVDIGPVLAVAPGEPPYPETMSRAAVAEIAAVGADAVVAKGDLTASGTVEEHGQFLACYGILGARLVSVRGNHDNRGGADFAAEPVQERTLPGIVLAVLDTSVPGSPRGRLASDQLDWLDELAARSDRPVLVLGHHQPWNPDSATREPDYFGIDPDSSERLVDVVVRRPAIMAYAAGHTHRNRVRRFSATGEVPWVEVSAVKDFPGAWAEYRVFEGGILQVVRRIAAPEALEWTERTRGMFAGLYAGYSFGALHDRCLPIAIR